MNQEQLYSNPQMCCGCEACVNICPKDVISMVRDEEGFYYPQIIREDECINCHLCLKVCPIKHYQDIKSTFTRAYAGHAKDKNITTSSSSGGFATVLARAFLNRTNGVFYGVVYDDDFMSVRYSKTECIDHLSEFQTSKYSQARKNEVYKQIEEDLKTKKVLFVGTPCDAYALLRFVSNTENLYIVSLICHGPTSEKIHSLFCTKLEREFGGSIQSFSLRHKFEGHWKPYFIKATFSNGQEFLKKFDETTYNTAFIYFKRPSCTVCRLKKDHFAGDILIGDYHAGNPGTKAYHLHGVSSMLPLTPKGQYLLEMVQNAFEILEVSVDSSTGQQAVHTPVKKNINRTLFVNMLNSEGLDKACAISSIRYDQKKTRIKRVIRGFLGQQKRRMIKALKK